MNILVFKILLLKTKVNSNDRFQKIVFYFFNSPIPK